MLDVVHNFLRLVPPVDRVLEIGSYNVNGTARDAIVHKEWLGVDLRSGPCVDMVCDARALPFDSETFDCLVIAETLEHCEDWGQVLLEGWRCLKVKGIAAITAPSPGFPRHEFPNDFWRFTMADFARIFGTHLTVALLQYPLSTAGIIVQKLNRECKPRIIGSIMGAPKE